MRPVQKMLSALIGVVGLIFLPVLQAVAENIYHWKDRNGISCYTNTNIPSGTTEFSVMPAAWSATSQVDEPDVADDVDMGENETSVLDGFEAVFDSRAAVLRDRIERRQASIHSIENRLKTHPNDSGLRKNLYKKKQYLHEDILRLKLLQE